MGKTYDDAKYGVIQRMFVTPYAKDDVATAGTELEAFITLPEKSKIVAFGIMSAGSDVVMATSDGFELRTHNGTKLATWVADADYTLGSGSATCCAPETATTIAKNKSMVCCVATDTGVRGSVVYFVDYSPEVLGC